MAEAVEAPVAEADRLKIEKDSDLNIRGKDRKKMDIEWNNPNPVWTVPDGPHEGYTINYINDPIDLAMFGKQMGHCAGTHFVWAIEEKLWYFFSLVSPTGVPHSTIFTKDCASEYFKVSHPRVGMPGPKTIRDGMYGYYCTWPEVLAAYKGKDLPEPGTYGPVSSMGNLTYGWGPGRPPADTAAARQERLDKAIAAEQARADEFKHYIDTMYTRNSPDRAYYMKQRNTCIGKIQNLKANGLEALPARPIAGRIIKFDGTHLKILEAHAKGEYGYDRGTSKYATTMARWIDENKLEYKGKKINA